MKEAELIAAKRESIDIRREDKPMLPPGNVEDDDRIKFISMIDQKPIKPSYLELIPFKNFSKKEMDANRNKK